MIIISKVQIAPGQFVNVETKIPEYLIAAVLLAVTLSIYNLYR